MLKTYYRFKRLVYSFTPKSFNQMKAIRYLAASMFLLTGILHFYLWLNPTPTVISPNGMLIGGIVYSATGVLLLMKVGFARWLGLFPIVPIVMTPFMLDLSSLDWSMVWFPIELVAVICCIILLVKKSKG
jgi:hypothetical protein